jgi:hypothetical protein
MTFTDIYAISDFSVSTKQRFSLSIDEVKNKIVPVILLVPDLDLPDHDHVFIGLEEINNFKNFLNTKGHSRFDSGHYSLIIHEYSMSKPIKVQVYYKNHETQSPKLQYEVLTSMEKIEEMKLWVAKFEKQSKDELWHKYQQDLKRK